MQINHHDMPIDRHELVADWAYINPNQFTDESDYEAVSVAFPRFEDVNEPEETRQLAKRISDIIQKPITIQTAYHKDDRDEVWLDDETVTA